MFQSSDGLNLFYTDEGEGRPVLCLAGLTRNGDDFTYLAPHLKGCRVIRLDYRGRGSSDYDPDFNNYNTMREGQDAIELLDHLGLEKVTLIGTSRGGLIAMALAHEHAARLQAVVLNDIGPDVDPGGLARIMGYVGKAPEASGLDQLAEQMQTAGAAEFPGVPLERWREQAGFRFYEKDTGGIGLRYDAGLREALLAQGASGTAPDLWGLFDLMQDIPIAVIRGANSDLLSASTLARMQARHDGLIAATVPNRGHTPFLDEPEALDAITRLLEQSA